MDLQAFPYNNVCRVCLKTGEDISPMSEDHIKLFKSLLDEVVYQEYNMSVCSICDWLLQKMTKFKLQCWTANSLLNQACEDTKSINFLEKLTISHNFCQTQTDKSQYIPKRNTKQNDTQMNVIYTNDLNDTDNYQSYESYDIFDAKHNEPYTNDMNMNDHKDITSDFESSLKRNDTYSNDDVNDMKCEAEYDGDGIMSEDEIPLLLLSQQGEGKKKKCKRKGELKIETSLEHSKNNHIKTKKKFKKTHKNKLKTLSMDMNQDSKENGVQEKTETCKKLREGFSNRMVQETSEYIVIRRTKQQVLEEMCERAASDVYSNLPYRCERCVKGFNFREVLDKHLEKHSQKNGPLQCDICEQYCPSAVSLRGHMKSHTTRYKCKVCGSIKASRQHLLEHHAAHLGAAPVYRCDACPFTTDKRTVMQRHARTHSASAPLACHECGKLCQCIATLRTHVARHDKSRRHACAACGQRFLYYSLLRRHARAAHHGADLYCVECDVRFTSQDSLRAHLKKAKRHRDSGENKHICASCGAGFFTSASLAAHMSSAHDAPRAHACTLCHKHYSSRATLRAHVWRSHGRGRGDSRATCHHCGTTFARKSSLTAHILRTHTEASAYSHSKPHAHMHSKHKEGALQQYESKSEV